jgi:hypothetical protein
MSALAAAPPISLRFASFLQQRSWRFQNAARLRGGAPKGKRSVPAVSSLVDKRLYRMQRLLRAVSMRAGGQ